MDSPILRQISRVHPRIMGGSVLSGEKRTQISRQLLLTNAEDTTSLGWGAFGNLYHVLFI